MTLVIVSLPRHLGVALAATMIVVSTAQLPAAQELPKNFAMHDRSKPVAAIHFEDRQGRAGSLADFKDKIVLLNVWATWCVSCRQEMPALDRLQATLGGSSFEIVPVSIDRSGIPAVAKFYAQTNVSHLAMYVDTSGKVLREIGAIGLPTTLIIDRQGREIGRIVGPVEWDAAEIAELLKAVIARPSIAAEDTIQDTQDETSHGPFARGWQWLKALFTR